VFEAERKMKESMRRVEGEKKKRGRVGKPAFVDATP
jgi:hypothetical protein